VGNVDKHRRTYSNGVRAMEESKWGADKARERYGALKTDMKPPKDTSFPQFKEEQRGPDWADDVANDWRRGFGKNGVESSEGKPGYVTGGGKK